MTQKNTISELMEDKWGHVFDVAKRNGDRYMGTLMGQIYLLAWVIDGLMTLEIDENGEDLYTQTDKFPKEKGDLPRTMRLSKLKSG